MDVIRSGVDRRLVLPAAGPFGIQKFLDRMGSGIGRVTFIPREGLLKIVHGGLLHATQRGRTHTVAMWLGRCAEWFKVSRRWLLMLLQAEQGLIRLKAVLPIEYFWKWTERKKTNAPNAKILTVGKKRIEVVGNWKMLAGCGYGFPSGSKVYATKYLGLPAQILYAAKYARDRLAEFDKGKRKVRLASGEVVHCEDPVAFLTTLYTPFKREVPFRIGEKGVYNSMFKEEA